ncbi:MAG: O-antigen ligase family protein [Candidatus Paceibacterota bacterium]
MIKSTSRFIALAALFLIPFFPLIVANSYFFPFITGKAFYFRILVEIAFASYIVLAFIDARYRPRLNAMTIAVTLFALIVLAADLLGVNPLRSLWSNFERMEGWITIAHLWMFYITTSGLFGFNSSHASNEESMKWWRAWMNTFIVGGIIVSIYALVQFFGGAEIHQGSSRIDASLGNAAYLAVYMLMNVGIAVYMLFDSRKKSASKQLQWLYGALSVLFAFILFETATRGTMIGLVGGTMLTLFLYAVLAKQGSKNSRMICGGIIIAIVLATGIFWANRQSTFVQNHEALRRLASISINDAKTQARGYIWPMALTGFTQRPVLGWGQENFNYIFNANYNPAMWTQEQWFDRAHNVYLDWLVAAGSVGLIAYLSLYFLLFRGIWKSHLGVAQKSVLTGLGAAYAVHNIFVFDNLASYVAFFAILAFVSSALYVERKGKPVPVLGSKKDFSLDIVEYVVIPVCIVALIAGLYFFNVRVIIANTRLITALQACNTSQADAAFFQKVFATGAYVAYQETREQIVSCTNGVLGNQQVPGPAKQLLFTEAVNAIQAQIASAPKDARMYVLGGQFMNAAGQVQLAQVILEQAHALTPRKQSVSFELANNYINSGNVEKGLALLKEAYESDPSYGIAQSAYALGLVLSGEEAKAKQIFPDRPDIFTTEQAAQVYAAAKAYGKSLAIYSSLVEKKPTDVNLKVHMAQVQYAAGQKNAAVATLRSIEKDNPQFKAQIDAAVAEVLK